ncbi:prolyl oligopeptidase [Emericellopsis atlantica]|uniref:Dipeptidyl-peptidase V n=1 Tax=Emericellopsis atlantica TaxID=2614577 RepID=A0A9P7ZX18_9HYPO|nr:prolyl oligopeptidase [Emericellopsis atlantica]KAG9259052.1 prolyl oligopeptidase [Emericellopsis atlantica]
MVRVEKLTAKTVLEAPNYSPPVPNANGTQGLFTVSTYDFASGKHTQYLRVIDLAGRGVSTIVSGDNIHDAHWIPGPHDEILYVQSDDKGKTQVKIARTGDLPGDHDWVMQIDAPIANLKLKLLREGQVAFVFTGLAGDDGELFNEEAVEKKNSARVFDTTYVRTWTSYYKPQRYGLWYTILSKNDGPWELKWPCHNLLHNSPDIEPHSLYGPFGNASTHYDIAPNGIAFNARKLETHDLQEKQNSYPYYCPLDSYEAPPPAKPAPIALPENVSAGQASNMRLSPNGEDIGFFHASADDIINIRLYIASIKNLASYDAFKRIDPDEDPEHYEPPASFEFAGRSDTVIMQKKVTGRMALAQLVLKHGEKPRYFTFDDTVASYAPLRAGDWTTLLVARTSFLESALWQIINVPGASVDHTIFCATKNGRKYGLHEGMVSDIWFEGADGLCVHALVVRPSTFDANKKYPWVLALHGGPLGDWSTGWSPRWNAAAWAEQGYILILPNISGSTGYGLDFARRVNDEWGGKPYQDIVNLVEHLDQIPYLDHAKGILTGLSYGGYMMSWLFSHEVSKRFCGAIWQDGIFSIPTMLLQSDVSLDTAAFGTKPPYPWENAAHLEKFNPARPELLRKWAEYAPPTLVVHGEKDYRCPVTEGLAVFNTLQTQGVPSKMLLFEDEGHMVVKPENMLVCYEATWAWMQKCIQGDLENARRG